MIELIAQVATRNSLKVVGWHLAERSALPSEVSCAVAAAGAIIAADAGAVLHVSDYDHTYCARESHDGF